MRFYQQFSTYYDDIFTKKSSKVDFLADKLSADQNQVLDIATGTGNYAIALAAKGYSVKGLDLSEAMIKQARAKVKNQELDLEFKVADMMEINQIYNSGQFDLIYCIGNSIVHLANQAEIKDVLEQIYELLTKEGTLVIQIVNYDRVLTNNVTSLPTINNYNKGLKLVRNYELVNQKQINFKTKLHTEEGIFENTVPLYPLQSNQLKELVNQIGYAKIDLYGDFNYGEYQPLQSFPLVAVIEK
ncbi:MAG: class I SAM-dependent methyltransferase [Bacillota bacterium]